MTFNSNCSNIQCNESSSPERSVLRRFKLWFQTAIPLQNQWNTSQLRGSISCPSSCLFPNGTNLLHTCIYLHPHSPNTVSVSQPDLHIEANQSIVQNFLRALVNWVVSDDFGLKHSALMQSSLKLGVNTLVSNLVEIFFPKCFCRKGKRQRNSI